MAEKNNRFPQRLNLPTTRNIMKTIQIIIYNLLQWFIVYISLPVLIPLAFCSHKRKQTLWKRLGFRTTSVSGQPFWIHALSVGEVLSAFPLIEAIHEKWPSQPIVFSSSTLTGYEMAQRMKPFVNELFYFPYDFLFSSQWMIHKINPCLFILVESDIWPNFLTQLKKKHIPAILLNARLSRESFRGYRLLKWFMEPVLQSFSVICTQSDIQASRFSSFGIEKSKIKVTGNVKYDQSFHQLAHAEVAELKKSLCIRQEVPVIIAGSTHSGEESIFIDLYSKLRKSYADLKLIIAPRDPSRANEIQLICRTHNFVSTFISQNDPAEQSILIIDQMGLLGKLYAVCDIAFIGGSLVPEGGHNPLEPAAMAKPIIFGPDMHDFPEISKLLVENQAAFQVETNMLFDIVSELLEKPVRARIMGQNGRAIVEKNRGAVQASLHYIEDLCQRNYFFEDEN